MRLLVGLGNPGERYARTRHNVGFRCIDEIAKELGVASWKQERGGENAKIAEGFLLKPTQYMNLSGGPIRELSDYYRIEPSDICVIADDVYLAPGSVRIRRGGESGGHNGLKSVLENLPNEFLRVRIGVGVYGQRPEERAQGPALEDYVLQAIPTDDEHNVSKIIDELVPNLIKWLKHGTLAEETLHVPSSKS